MGKVTSIYGGKLPVDQVIETVKEWDLKDVVIIGIDGEGEPLLFSSQGKLSEIHLLLSRVQNLIVTDYYVE